MLTILERLRVHCFPTTYKTLFISKPEQHHRMTRHDHHYCPCNNSWIELYAFFCQPLPKLQLVSRCGRFIATYVANSFFFAHPPSPCSKSNFPSMVIGEVTMGVFYLASYLNCCSVLQSSSEYSQKCRHTSEQSTGRQKPLNCLCEGLLVNYKLDFNFCYFAVHFLESFCFAYF